MTGASIIVTDINVRQTLAGTVDVMYVWSTHYHRMIFIHRTDVKFFVLLPEQRKIVDPNAVLRSVVV